MIARTSSSASRGFGRSGRADRAAGDNVFELVFARNAEQVVAVLPDFSLSRRAERFGITLPAAVALRTNAKLGRDADPRLLQTVPSKFETGGIVCSSQRPVGLGRSISFADVLLFLGAVLKGSYEFCCIKAYRLCHIDEFDNIQSPLAEFVFGDKGWWLPKSSSDNCLSQACRFSFGDQRGAKSRLPI